MTNEKLIELRAAYERVGSLRADKEGIAILCDAAPADAVNVWNRFGDVFDELFAVADDARRMRETLMDLQLAAVDVLASTTSRLDDPDADWQARLNAIAKG